MSLQDLFRCGREVKPHPTVAKPCRYGKLVRSENKAPTGKSRQNSAAGNGHRALPAHHNRFPLLRPRTQEEDRDASSAVDGFCPH